MLLVCGRGDHRLSLVCDVIAGSRNAAARITVTTALFKWLSPARCILVQVCDTLGKSCFVGLCGVTQFMTKEEVARRSR
jgi:hypothetical protein